MKSWLLDVRGDNTPVSCSLAISQLLIPAEAYIWCWVYALSNPNAAFGDSG